jgi:hypothetical protein
MGAFEKPRRFRVAAALAATSAVSVPFVQHCPEINGCQEQKTWPAIACPGESL